MKYYLIFEHTGNPNTKRTVPSFIVEREDTAKDFCKEFHQFYYEERDSGQYVFATPATIMPEASVDINPLSKGLYDGIKCPHCGASYFRVGASWSTAMYCPTIIKDGKVISEDHNIVTTEYECLNCGKTFTI